MIKNRYLYYQINKINMLVNYYLLRHLLFLSATLGFALSLELMESQIDCHVLSPQMNWNLFIKDNFIYPDSSITKVPSNKSSINYHSFSAIIARLHNSLCRFHIVLPSNAFTRPLSLIAISVILRLRITIMAIFAIDTNQSVPNAWLLPLEVGTSLADWLV